MDKETKAAYEQDRIPPSVFATTPKQEWSIQSNESLFSIHMGDHSFSTMYKSGDLSNADYTSLYTNNNNNIDNKIALTDDVHIETGPKSANRDALTNVSKPEPPQPIPISPTKSYRSDTSNNSTASFAFPTLPEYKSDRKTGSNMNSESRKTERSKSDQKPGLYPIDVKEDGGGGWLACLFCFSPKK